MIENQCLFDLMSAYINYRLLESKPIISHILTVTRLDRGMIDVLLCPRYTVPTVPVHSTPILFDEPLIKRSSLLSGLFTTLVVSFLPNFINFVRVSQLCLQLSLIL